MSITLYSTDKVNTPYTFTQKSINSEALKQDKYWYDKKGKLYEIKLMAPVHALNAATKLLDAYGKDAMMSKLYIALLEQAQT